MNTGSSSAAAVVNGRHEWTPPDSLESAASKPARGRRPLRRLAYRHDERGQASVEFALVVPLLCLIVLALVDFGKAVNYWLDANHLANEGARLAAVVGDSAQPSPTLTQWLQQQAETTELRDGTGSVTSPAKVCVTFLPGPTGTTGQIGDPVKVTVTAPYKWIPFVGAGTFTIRADATMRLERRPPATLNNQCSS